jgi:hypothetical protein
MGRGSCWGSTLRECDDKCRNGDTNNPGRRTQQDRKSDSKLTTARQFQRAGPAASVSWRDYRDERCASTYSQKLLSIAFVLLRR